MPNNLAYYVDGDETAATALRLVLNVNAPETAQEARRKLLDTAKVLYEKALADPIPEEIVDHIDLGADIITHLHGKEVALSKDEWPGHRTGGHSMEFIIRNIPS